MILRVEEEFMDLKQELVLEFLYINVSLKCKVMGEIG